MGLVGDEITSLGTNLSGSEDRIFTLGSNVHRFASFDMPETQYVGDFPGLNCINLHGFADVHGVSIVWNPFLSNLHSPMACMAADLHPPLHKPWRLWLRPPWPGWDAVKPSISGGLFDLYHWKGKVSTQLKRKKRSEKNQVGCVVDVLLPKTEKRVGCFATINSHHQ